MSRKAKYFWNYLFNCFCKIHFSILIHFSFFSQRGLLSLHPPWNITEQASFTKTCPLSASELFCSRVSLKFLQWMRWSFEELPLYPMPQIYLSFFDCCKTRHPLLIIFGSKIEPKTVIGKLKTPYCSSSSNISALKCFTDWQRLLKVTSGCCAISW